MYIPRHFHFAISTFVSLLGFWLKHKLGDSYDVVIVFLVLQFQSIMHALYIMKAGLLYQAYITHTEYRHEQEPIINHHTGTVVDLTPPPSDGFIPLGRKPVATVPVYQQVVSLPRFDKERNFAVTLIRMYEFDPNAVDMTQAKWVKTGKFVRAEFVAMLDNWKHYGLIVRASEKKNAPYRVDKWEAVRLIANGNPLPPSPLK